MSEGYHCPRCRELSTKLTTLTLLAARADLCTPAERAVLDALAAIDDEVIELNVDGLGAFMPVMRAELARREASALPGLQPGACPECGCFHEPGQNRLCPK